MTKAPWSYLKKQLLPIGLDLGATGLRAVQLYRRGREIGVYTAMELPFKEEPETDSTGMQESPVTADADTQDNGAKNLVADILHEGGFWGTSLIIHCPADRLDLRPMTLPAGADQLPRETILQTIRLQMKQHIRFDIDKAIIDFYFAPSSNAGAETSLIAITADGDWIRHRVKQLHQWGWQCHGVVPLPAALSRLAATMAASPFQDNQTEATPLLKPILCIGQHHMVLTVHLDAGPVFSRVYPFGGNVMADALALRLQVNLSQAARLVRNYGLAGTDIPTKTTSKNTAASTALAENIHAQTELDQQIARAVRTALRDEVVQLAEGLTRALNYVINLHPQARLDHVRCCGGGAHTPGLIGELSDQLEWPVEIISHPLLDVIQSQWPAHRAPAGQWAAALALALPPEDNRS